MDCETPAREVIIHVEKHVRQVVKQLAKKHPGKKLHEISWEDLLQGTCEFIAGHKDFRIQDPETGSGFIPMGNLPEPEAGRMRRVLYWNYELGHQILTERMLTQLKAEGVLPPEHEKRFKTALGRTYLKSSIELRQQQLRAFTQLERKMDKAKLEKLILRAKEVWKQNDIQQRKTHEADFEKYKILRDALHNPGGHNLLTSFTVDEPSTIKTPIEEFRKKLEDRIS